MNLSSKNFFCLYIDVPYLFVPPSSFFLYVSHINPFSYLDERKSASE